MDKSVADSDPDPDSNNNTGCYKGFKEGGMQDSNLEGK